MGEFSTETNKSKFLAIGGWTIAGFPIIASAFQAISHMIGVEVANWPLIGILADFVHNFEIFRLMSLAFESPEPVVLLLFVLITISWGVLGLSLFRPTTTLVNYSEGFHRSTSIVTGLIFSLLFAGVYWNLWDRTLSFAQRTLLVFFPIGVLSGLYVSYWAQPRTSGYRLLDEAEEAVMRERDKFESASSGLRSAINRLHPEFPEDVDVDSLLATRKERAFNDVLTKIEDYRDRSMTKGEREIAARELHTQEVEGLDGSQEYQDIESNARSELARAYRDAYANTTIKSERFEEEFELMNRDAYRSFDVRASSEWSTISLNGLDEVADSFVDEVEDIEEVIEMINATAEHFDGEDGIRKDLEQQEAEFVEIHDDVINHLENVEERFEKLPPKVGDRLKEIYLHGRVPGYDTIAKIHSKYGGEEGKLDKAVTDFHRCLFSDSTHSAKEARAMAEHLDNVTGFIEHLVRASEQGVTGVDVPDLSHTSYRYFDHGLIENEIANRIDGVRLTCHWDESRIGLKYTDSDRPEYGTGSKIPSEDQESEDGEIQESRLKRGVEHVLNGITSGELGSRDDNLIAIQKSDIAEIYRENRVIERTADHLDEQNDLIEGVKRNSLPEHLEFRLADGTDFRQSMKEVTNRFEQQ